MALMIPLEEATKIVAEAMTDAYERGRGIGEAERKVIEAAKAWIKHIDYIGGPKLMPSEDKMLHASIKALLAAEGEE